MTGWLSGRVPVLVGLGLGLALTVTLAACGDDGSSSDPGGSSPSDEDEAEGLEDVAVIEGSEADVTALDNTFNDENIQVEVGATVVWTNDGRQDHDIVPADEGMSWGVDPEGFEPDAVYEHTFDQPGVYRYYCSLHGTRDAGMIGAVVVTE
jgi:plastocyanin